MWLDPINLAPVWSAVREYMNSKPAEPPTPVFPNEGPRQMERAFELQSMINGILEQLGIIAPNIKNYWGPTFSKYGWTMATVPESIPSEATFLGQPMDARYHELSPYSWDASFAGRVAAAGIPGTPGYGSTPYSWGPAMTPPGYGAPPSDTQGKVAEDPALTQYSPEKEDGTGLNNPGKPDAPPSAPAPAPTDTGVSDDGGMGS